LGLAAVLLVMIPNIIWAIFPPGNNPLATDVLSLPLLDILENVFRTALIILLLLLTVRDPDLNPRNEAWLISSVALLVAYYFCWIIYFCGNTDPAILLGLAIAPSAFFCLYAFWLKNVPAFFVSVLFAATHIIITSINYL